MLSFTPSYSAALLGLTAQSSASQAGKVTDIAVVTFSGRPVQGMANIHYASSIITKPSEYPDQVSQPKTAGQLLREQIDNAVSILQEGVDKAGEALRDTWRNMIQRGEFAGDADASFEEMGKLAEKPESLPAELREMVQAFVKAEKSMNAVRYEAFKTSMDMSMQELADAEREAKGMIKRAVEDLVDAQLAIESGVQGSMPEAETALMLIRLMNNEAPVVPQGNEAVSAVIEGARQAAHQDGRNDLIDS